ncbi:MAG: hypothetical protein HOY71_56400, partial [Nonomuraea sp.]|nr:hypothetical protein [Nonomuraea sp.]
AMVTATADRRYTAVWQQDTRAYVQDADLTPDAFRQKLAALKGVYPAVLQVAGDANHPVYTAVWAPE